ncbi:MAG: glycosyltransferase family 39 protein, partial [Deltaproteobacteria bacterium]
MSNPRSASPTQTAVLLASFPVLLGFQLLIFDRWISFMDEGHILQLADVVARGGELYRDATTYPLPGAYYLLAWMFELFETSNRAARYLVSVEFALLGVCVVSILRRFVPPALTLVGLVLVIAYRVWSFPHWHIYTYSATALCLLAAALALLLRFLETGNRRVLAAAGLVGGLGALCKQDYGAAALLALNLTLLLRFASRPAGPREALVP